jgi:branched-chain amino acid transport system permease protein
MSTLSDILALVVSGLASGSAYALLALGIVIIFRSTDTVNFAIGHTGVLALYCAGTLRALDAPVIVILLTAVALGGLFGIATERLLVKAIGQRKNFTFIALVITIGLSFLLHAGTGYIWGHQLSPFPALVTGTVQIGNFAVPWNKLISAILAVISMGMVAVFFGRTALGAAMRGSAEDPFAAKIVGLNSDYIAMLAWCMGCALATLAMFFLAAELSLSTSLSEHPLFRAFAGVFLGGLTSMPGAVVGGFIIGILDNLASAYVSPNFRDTIVFAVILLVLFLKPAGILGVLTKARV